MGGVEEGSGIVEGAQGGGMQGGGRDGGGVSVIYLPDYFLNKYSVHGFLIYHRMFLGHHGIVDGLGNLG